MKLKTEEAEDEAHERGHKGVETSPASMTGICMRVAAPAGVGTGRNPIPVVPNITVRATRSPAIVMSLVCIFKENTSVPARKGAGRMKKFKIYIAI